MSLTTEGCCFSIESMLWVLKGGCVQVSAVIEQEKAKNLAKAPMEAENLDKAKAMAAALKNEPRPALTPEAMALSPGNNPGASVKSGALG